MHKGFIIRDLNSWGSGIFTQGTTTGVLELDTGNYMLLLELKICSCEDDMYTQSSGCALVEHTGLFNIVTNTMINKDSFDYIQGVQCRQHSIHVLPLPKLMKLCTW